MKLCPLIAVCLAVETTHTHASPRVIDLNKSTNHSTNLSDDAMVVTSTAHQTKAKQGSTLTAHLYQTARRYRVDPLLIKAIIQAESNYQANARSPKGALGLMQVLPTTAAQYGNYNLLNPKENITVGIRHFAYLMKRYQEQVHLALAAYNAGEGNVAKYGGIPPFTETRQYIIKVSKHYQRLRANGGIAQEPNHQQALSTTQDRTTNESSPPNKPPTVLIINLN